MKINYVLAGVMVALSLGACSKKGGGDSDAEAFVKLDTDKGVAFAAGATCEEKAKSVGDWRKAHTAEYKAMQKKFSPEQVKAMKEKYGPQLEKNKDAVMKTMLDCSSNEAFGKMMDETKVD